MEIPWRRCVLLEKFDTDLSPRGLNARCNKLRKRLEGYTRRSKQTLTSRERSRKCPRKKNAFRIQGYKEEERGNNEGLLTREF